MERAAMMGLALIPLALVLAAPGKTAAPAAVANPSFEELLARFDPMPCDDPYNDAPEWSALADTSPCQRLAESIVHGKRTLPELARVLAEDFSLPMAAAEHFTRAELSAGQGKGPAHAERTRRELIAALRAAPDSAAIRGHLMRLVEPEEPAARTFWATLNAVKAPKPLLDRLLGAIKPWNPWFAALNFALLERSPQSWPEVAARQPGDQMNPPNPLLMRRLVRLAQQRKETGSGAFSLQMARSVRRALDGALPILAVQWLREAPAPVRTAIESGGPLPGSNEPNPFAGPVPRLELAAAFLQARDEPTARRIQAGVSEGSVENPHDRDCDPELLLLALRLAGKPPPEDAFELAEKMTFCGQHSHYVGLLLPLVGPQYPWMARQHLERTEYWITQELEQARKLIQPLRPQWAAAAAELAAARKAELQRIRALVAPFLARAKAPKRTRRPALEARLASAPRSVFSERRLPAGTPAFHGDPEDPRESISLPGGLAPVRVERHGQDVTAVALSREREPMDGAGGVYWLLRSVDGGRTWGAPVYTGLRHQQPYVIVPTSRVPLCKGDTLRLEARRIERDESAQPMAGGVMIKRIDEGILLETTWAALERDSDGDGLTDLAEDRLLTNPAAADSDADGIPDAQDALPLSPRTARRPPEAEVLAAALEAIIRGAEPKPATASSGPSPESFERTLIVVGEPSQFGDGGGRIRILAITREELEKGVDARVGVRPYPVTFSRVLLNKAGERAFISWEQRTRGGTFRAKKEEGRWQFEVLSRWAI